MQSTEDAKQPVVQCDWSKVNTCMAEAGFRPATATEVAQFITENNNEKRRRTKQAANKVRQADTRNIEQLTNRCLENRAGKSEAELEAENKQRKKELCCCFGAYISCATICTAVYCGGIYAGNRLLTAYFNTTNS
jgi:hypothetical protein